MSTTTSDSEGEDSSFAPQTKRRGSSRKVVQKKYVKEDDSSEDDYESSISQSAEDEITEDESDEGEDQSDSDSLADSDGDFYGKKKNNSPGGGDEDVSPERSSSEVAGVEKLLSHRTTEDEEDEFLVKYKDKSYLHVEWLSKDQLCDIDRNGALKIKRFLSKPIDSVHYSDSELFNPSFTKIDRVIEKHTETDDKVWFLVKWCALQYDCATWETEDDLLRLVPNAQKHIDELVERSTFVDMKPIAGRTFKKIEKDHAYKHDNKLREYQLEGVNWLLHCWCNNQGSIIADEMGLGKTVQTVAFLNQLMEFYKIRGPFLIIAPLSTIAHWEREVRRWTDMNVVVFHGSSASRDLIVETEFYFPDQRKSILKFNVLITTYEMAIAGASVLKNIRWKVAALDEAHRLKNKSSKIAEVLKMYSFDHRVLATGTPLQNRMEELWALLNFLEPVKFPRESDFLKQFGDLKKSEDVTKLQALLKPLMLRRLKEDVEKTIPVKEETIVEVELTGPQKKYYRAILERNFGFLSKGCKASNMPNLINTMMELRKCCIHPYLINGAEDRIIDEAKAFQPEEQFNLMIQASGKLVLVDKLLKKLKQNGHRVLIFSQMTKCLDLLADYLRGRGYRFERIDGAIRGELRQAAIDRFCDPESDSFVFLLCTRAGGVGINLTAADTVVIFDSDWNPQNDLQAQARCHRIGQTKSVKIYRLITRNTYEREMFDRASKKLGLDKAILQKMPGLEDENKTPQLSKKEVEQLLKKGAYGVMMENDEDAIKFCEEDIDQILARRTQVIIHDNKEQAGSIFSKASFTNAADDVDLEDPLFWEKWAAKANLDVDALLEEDSLIIDEPRQRKPTQRIVEDLTSSKDSGGETDLDYSDLEDLRFEKKAPRLWSVAERQRLEKKLLTFGFRNFDRFSGEFPFRSSNDLIACSRALIDFCLESISNETEADQKFKADFAKIVMPIIGSISYEDDIDVPSEIEDKDGDSRQDYEPRKNPREPTLYVSATARQIAEFRSFLGKRCPEEYRESIKRKGKTILARLYQIHLLLFRLNYDNLNSWEEIDIPKVVGTAPSEWWSMEDDKSFAYGICKHGMNMFSEIQKDPELPFAERTFEDETNASGNNIKKEEAEDLSVDDDEIPELLTSEAGQSGEGAGPTTEDSVVADIAAVKLANDARHRWPSKTDLALRMKRIFLAVQRRYQTEQRREKAAAIKAIQEPKQPVAESSGPKVKRTRTTPAEKWSKRDRGEFVRIAGNYGFPVKGDGSNSRDWSMFRTLSSSNLARKSDDIMDSFLVEFLPVLEALNHKAEDDQKADPASSLPSHIVASSNADYNTAASSQTASPRNDEDGLESKSSMTMAEMIASELSTERARRLYRKVALLSYIRENIFGSEAGGECLGLALAMIRRVGGLPVWWKNGVHDVDLLKGAAKYGFSRPDLFFTDETLSFAETYKEFMMKQQQLEKDTDSKEDATKEDGVNETNTEGSNATPMDLVKQSEEAERTSSPLEALESLDIEGKNPKYDNEDEDGANLINGFNLTVFDWPKDAFLVKRAEYLCELAFRQGKGRLPAIPWFKDSLNEAIVSGTLRKRPAAKDKISSGEASGEGASKKKAKTVTKPEDQAGGDPIAPNHHHHHDEEEEGDNNDKETKVPIKRKSSSPSKSPPRKKATPVKRQTDELLATAMDTSLTDRSPTTAKSWNDEQKAAIRSSEPSFYPASMTTPSVIASASAISTTKSPQLPPKSLIFVDESKSVAEAANSLEKVVPKESRKSI